MRTASIPRVMKHIAEGAITRGEAAEVLDVSERTVNRLMREHGVKRPASLVPTQRAAIAAKRKARLAVMQRVIDEAISIEEGAKLAGVSVRTVFRYLQRAGVTRKSRPRKRSQYRPAKYAKYTGFVLKIKQK